MAERKQSAPQVYVVQRLVEPAEGEGIQLAGAVGPWWEDFATVTVPARSKRKTIIEAALASRADAAPVFPATVRVLDADAAREHSVGLRHREPELEIG